MRARILLLVALLLAGCSTRDDAPAAEAPAGSHQDVLTLEPQGLAYPDFGAPFDMRVVARFVVTSGGPIDAWLADRAACAKYGTRGFVANATALGERAGTLQADLPSGAGCLILDNADFALGRANATGPVTVRYRIEVYER